MPIAQNGTDMAELCLDVAFRVHPKMFQPWLGAGW